jgi:hypothetical protein
MGELGHSLAWLSFHERWISRHGPITMQNTVKILGLSYRLKAKQSLKEVQSSPHPDCQADSQLKGRKIWRY